MEIDVANDLLRPFILALTVSNFLFAAVILIVYWKRVSGAGKVKTNLTRHVVTILLVFLLLLGHVFVDVLQRLNTEWTWRIPYLIPTLLLGLTSQFFMFNFQVKRWRRGE
ncbi:MAG: hypothetical protein M3367_03065 [Acidobacteriota bacterium]|nr:hypothetical protein [Acidobacteriota bacterium]